MFITVDHDFFFCRINDPILTDTGLGVNKVL